MPFFTRSPKANKDYEAFKKNYTTTSFKSEFTKLFNAAIADILKFIKTQGNDIFNFASQQALVEYYVNAKLVDTEILTKITFNKLNEFIKISNTDSQYELIKTLDLETLLADDPEGKQIYDRNKSMSSVLFKAAELNNNEYFLRLLVLLLTIRYYPYTIVEIIFQNGKNNIESIIKNISVMNGHIEAIQKIVDTIDPPLIADSPEAVDNDAVDNDAVNNDAVNTGAGVGIPNAAPASQPGLLGAFSSLFGTQNGGQVGETNDVASILETINRAQLVNDPAISQLVKYSTNILCNALTLLSVSINYPSDDNALLVIMPQLHANINTHFINKLTSKNGAPSDALQTLKDQLNTLIRNDGDYSNIIANISATTNSIKTVIAPVAIAHVARPRQDKLTEVTAIAFARGIIPETTLQSLSTEASNSAKKLIDDSIIKYVKKPLGIDKEYIKDVVNAVVSVYKNYSILQSLKDVVAAAKIAADNAYENKPYDEAISNYFNKLIPKPPNVRYGGALDDDYSLNINVQLSIIKGVESSTFFKLIPSEPVTGPARGGQRTQKNRNRNRGGTRKNMNSIETNIYDEV